MANVLNIDKISNQEIRILLEPPNQITKATVTAEDLYQGLGRYLKAGGPSPDDVCIIDI